MRLPRTKGAGDAFQFKCVHCGKPFATEASMLQHAARSCGADAAVAARQPAARQAKKDAAFAARQAQTKQGTGVRGSEENKEALFRRCLSPHALVEYLGGSDEAKEKTEEHWAEADDEVLHLVKQAKEGIKFLTDAELPSTGILYEAFFILLKPSRKSRRDLKVVTSFC